MKQTLSILTAVFAVLAFFVSCGGTEGSSGSGGIYGHVTDFVTGEDVANANVQLRPGGDTTLTGSDGMFEFRDLTSGDYKVTVSKVGYTDLIDDFVITVKNRMVRRDVQLKKESAMLRIVDDAGNDISELDFGDKLADVSRQFNIFNDSSVSISWDISWTAEWIKSLSKESGNLESGDTLGIIVKIDRTLLRKGENTTQLHIISNNGNKQLAIKATADVCNNNPCGEHGICKATDAETYECECDDVSHWNGAECLSPCDKDTCTHGKCVMLNYDEYECECDKGWLTDEKHQKCGNLCITLNNPCENGICVPTGAETYYCDCESEEDYFDGIKCSVLSEECSVKNKTPCKDSVTGFVWSAKSYIASTYIDAQSFCSNSREGGFSNWRVPNIDELRSLINGCSNTRIGGSCKVSATNGCLTPDNCSTNCGSCGTTDASTISKFGDTEWFWSSSPTTGSSYLWGINFSTGGLGYSENLRNVRCVR